MDKELKELLDLIMQGGESDKYKVVGPNCMIYAQMCLEESDVSVDVGASKRIDDYLSRELGKAYIEARDRTIKRLGDALKDFADEVDRIAAEREEGDKHE